MSSRSNRTHLRICCRRPVRNSFGCIGWRPDLHPSLSLHGAVPTYLSFLEEWPVVYSGQWQRSAASSKDLEQLKRLLRRLCSPSLLINAGCGSGRSGHTARGSGVRGYGRGACLPPHTTLASLDRFQASHASLARPEEQKAQTEIRSYLPGDPARVPLPRCSSDVWLNRTGRLRCWLRRTSQSDLALVPSSPGLHLGSLTGGWALIRMHAPDARHALGGR